MPRRDLHLPDSTALGDGAPDGRRCAPSARRNAAPILEVLQAHAPATGRALEIASGTGQHSAAFAAAFPGLDWQPSDLAPENITSIAAWRAASGSANLRAPILLDACAAGWAQEHGPRDLILAVNLLHLVSEAEASTLIAEAARALAPGGLLALYGPFRRDDGFASAGDADFHARLTAQDPATGYKPLAWVLSELRRAGLSADTPVAMPANNLMLLARHEDI